jgi:hypothetical protein
VLELDPSSFFIVAAPGTKQKSVTRDTGSEAGAQFSGSISVIMRMRLCLTWALFLLPPSISITMAQTPALPVPKPTPSLLPQTRSVPRVKPRTSPQATPSAWRWGASLLVGLPHPANLGIDFRSNSTWSFGATGGWLGASWQQSGTSVSAAITNFDLRARWHPFRGAFFLGVILGGQTARGSATDEIDIGGGTQVPTTVKAAIKSGYFTPAIGWFRVAESGFIWGFDLGIQIPLKPNTQIEVSIDDPTLQAALTQVQATAAFQKLERNVEAAGDKLGKIKLPYITVLRLGWMF